MTDLQKREREREKGREFSQKTDYKYQRQIERYLNTLEVSDLKSSSLCYITPLNYIISGNRRGNCILLSNIGCDVNRNMTQDTFFDIF